jgi:Lipase (class 3)
MPPSVNALKSLGAVRSWGRRYRFSPSPRTFFGAASGESFATFKGPGKQERTVDTAPVGGNNPPTPPPPPVNRVQAGGRHSVGPLHDEVDDSAARDEQRLKESIRQAYRSFVGGDDKGPIDTDWKRVEAFFVQLNQMDHISVIRTLLPVLTEELGPSASALSLYPALTSLAAWQSNRRDPKWLPGSPAMRNNASLHENVALLAQAYRACRWATAAYGWKGEAFFKMTAPDASFGFKDVSSLLRASVSGDAASFCRLAGVDRDHLLYESPDSTIGSPKHFVAVDEHAKCIVLAIRGTMSLSDALTDALARRVAFAGGQAHEGIAYGSHAIFSSVMDLLEAELKRRPGYGLLVTGHSLGSATSILFTILLLHHRAKHLKDRKLPRELIPFAGVDVKCVGFGTPPVFAGPLTEEMHSAIVNWCHNEDVVCRLSLDSLKDLMRVLGKIGSNLPPLHRRILSTFTSTNASEDVKLVDEILKDEPDYLKSWTGKEETEGTRGEGNPPSAVGAGGASASAGAGGPATPRSAAAGGGKADGISNGSSAAVDKRPRLRIPGTIYCFRAPVDVDASEATVDSSRMTMAHAESAMGELPTEVEKEVNKAESEASAATTDTTSTTLGLMKGWAKEEALAGGSKSTPEQAAEKAEKAGEEALSEGVVVPPPLPSESGALAEEQATTEGLLRIRSSSPTAAAHSVPSFSSTGLTPLLPMSRQDSLPESSSATPIDGPSAPSTAAGGNAPPTSTSDAASGAVQEGDAPSSSASSSYLFGGLKSIASSTMNATVSGLSTAVSAASSVASAAANATTSAGSMVFNTVTGGRTAGGVSGSGASPAPASPAITGLPSTSASEDDNVKLKPGIIETAAARAQQPMTKEHPFITVVAATQLGHLPVTNNSYRHHVPDMYRLGIKQLYELSLKQKEQQQQQARGQGVRAAAGAGASGTAAGKTNDDLKENLAAVPSSAKERGLGIGPFPKGPASGSSGSGHGNNSDAASGSSGNNNDTAGGSPSHGATPTNSSIGSGSPRSTAGKANHHAAGRRGSGALHFSTSAASSSPLLGSILMGSSPPPPPTLALSASDRSSSSGSTGSTTNANMGSLSPRYRHVPLVSYPHNVILPPASLLALNIGPTHPPSQPNQRPRSSSSSSTSSTAAAASPSVVESTGPSEGAGATLLSEDASVSFVAINTKSEKVGAGKGDEEAGGSSPFVPSISSPSRATATAPMTRSVRAPTADSLGGSSSNGGGSDVATAGAAAGGSLLASASPDSSSALLPDTPITTSGHGKE